jgi:hypothetical protein
MLVSSEMIRGVANSDVENGIGRPIDGRQEMGKLLHGQLCSGPISGHNSTTLARPSVI